MATTSQGQNAIAFLSVIEEGKLRVPSIAIFRNVQTNDLPFLQPPRRKGVV